MSTNSHASLRLKMLASAITFIVLAAVNSIVFAKSPRALSGQDDKIDPRTQQCANYLNSLTPPAMSGDTCTDARSAEAFYQNALNYIQSNCMGTQAQAFAGQLESLKQQAQQQESSMCVQ